MFTCGMGRLWFIISYYKSYCSIKTASIISNQCQGLFLTFLTSGDLGVNQIDIRCLSWNHNLWFSSLSKQHSLACIVQSTQSEMHFLYDQLSLQRIINNQTYQSSHYGLRYQCTVPNIHSIKHSTL